MYNEDIKNRFLDSLATQDLKKMYRSLFSRTDDYEKELDKDALYFDAKECTNLLIRLNPKSFGHIGSLKSQFSKYVDWGVQINAVSKTTGYLYRKMKIWQKNHIYAAMLKTCKN